MSAFVSGGARIFRTLARARNVSRSAKALGALSKGKISLTRNELARDVARKLRRQGHGELADKVLANPKLIRGLTNVQEELLLTKSVKAGFAGTRQVPTGKTRTASILKLKVQDGDKIRSVDLLPERVGEFRRQARRTGQAIDDVADLGGTLAGDSGFLQTPLMMMAGHIGREFGRAPVATTAFGAAGLLFIGREAGVPLAKGAFKSVTEGPGTRADELIGMERHDRQQILSQALKLERLRNVSAQNQVIMGQISPHLLTELQRGRRLPRGATVIGGKPSNNLINEIATAMATGAIAPEQSIEEQYLTRLLR